MIKTLLVLHAGNCPFINDDHEQDYFECQAPSASHWYCRPWRENIEIPPKHCPLRNGPISNVVLALPQPNKRWDPEDDSHDDEVED